jgi:uncharacterized protein involved in tolerance to divalent cations
MTLSVAGMRYTHNDVPELIVLPIQRGLPEYLAWLHDATNEENL